MVHRILVVDDENSMRLYLQGILKREGFEVDEAANGQEALQKIVGKAYDLVITDLKMPGMDGIVLVKKIKSRHPRTIVVVLTAFGTIETAVEAMKYGTADFLTKPLGEPRQLREMVRRLLGGEASGSANGQIITQDPLMLQVLALADRVAVTDSTVLITGETGTGKELMARTIHQKSTRSKGPFIPVNCAALPDNLLESELFGFEKGAFTGAYNSKEGFFRLADGGTIFLDEIGDISPALQVRLLRVLQEKEVQPLGASKARVVNLRVIAATNRNLANEVSEGNFREDLYYRLNVFPMELPPIRERKQDLILLAEYFLKKFSQQLGKPLTSFTPSAQEALRDYHWPGNIREMANMVERGVIMAAGSMLGVEDLLFQKSLDLNGTIASCKLKDLEKDTIIKSLRDHNGNRQKVAQVLGISIRTLQYKLKEYGLTNR